MRKTSIFFGKYASFFHFSKMLLWLALIKAKGSAFVHKSTHSRIFPFRYLLFTFCFQNRLHVFDCKGASEFDFLWSWVLVEQQQIAGFSVLSLWGLMCFWALYLFDVTVQHAVICLKSSICCLVVIVQRFFFICFCYCCCCISQVTIFQECQPEFLHDLVLKMKAYIFTPGDSICRKGEVAREMFIIADGILEVLSETGKVLTTMKAGDFFGEIGILNLDGLNKWVQFVCLIFERK